MESLIKGVPNCKLYFKFNISIQSKMSYNKIFTKNINFSIDFNKNMQYDLYIDNKIRQNINQQD